MPEQGAGAGAGAAGTWPKRGVGHSDYDVTNESQSILSTNESKFLRLNCMRLLVRNKLILLNRVYQILFYV